MQVQEYAQIVDDAAHNAQAIAQFPAGAFDVQTAYEIQAASIQRRLQRGEQRTGIKMGFTSLAKMQQMGVSDLIWGRLTDKMLIAEGGETRLDRFIHPRVEPELAFLLNRTLVGQVTMAEAQAAIEAVAPALEIIDSRYENFQFSLPDVIADNASSSGYVIGPYNRPDQPLDNLGILMSVNGNVVQVGSSAAILGHPLRSLVHAARLAELADQPLQPGWIVMAGAATAAVPLSSGDHVKVEVQELGTASFSVAGG